MKMPKWNRIGYVEGYVNVDETTTLRVRSILFVLHTYIYVDPKKNT